MARISTYPILSTPTVNDLLIGTDVENLNETKNFSIGDIGSLIGQDYVPYVGATGNVNLGSFNITAAAFIIPGGLASQFVKADGSLDSTAYTPQTRTLTINGTTYNLSANRSWDLNTIDSLTTTGTSGAATYIGKVLNIPVYQAQGNYITQLSGEATGSGPGNASVTLSNSAVIGKVLTGLNVTGGTVVSTDTILQAFGKVQNQINGLTTGVTYQGVWNAATNVPFLQSSVGTKGYYYVVDVAGTTNLNGITDWQVGDWAIYNGTTWDKVDNTDAVVSVNGYVGAVVLTASDVGAVPTTRTLTINGVGYNLSLDRAWTVGDVRTDGSYANPSWITSLGWSKITGTPTTLAGYGITDGALNTTTLTINGTTYDLTANRTWNVGTVTSVGTSGPLTGGTITGSGTIGITQSGASSDGYLSSTDWNAFNSKQAAISVTAPITLVAGVLGITQSSSTTDGYLSSTDWNTFNSKVSGSGTANTLPMWGSASSLINSPLSYAADTFNFQYNSATGGTVNFTNIGLSAYTYSIQMNNFGSPRSTIHSYTDGLIIQSIGGTQVSRMFANGNLILGTGTVDNGYKLEITGNLYVNTIANATVDTDRFIVSDGGVIKYRTGSEILADIGAVSSVGLTMPSAFTVSNSPITSSGTIGVTAAGTAAQYIRGDGTLADFPTTGGGGSSVSYYLNGSVNQGTFGGNTYYEMSKTPILGAGTDFSIGSNGYIAQFITDAGDPNLLEIPGGNWNLEFYFSASSGGGSPNFYVELYKYNGTTFTLIASNSTSPELIAFGTTINPYFSSLAVSQTSLLATDRLAIRIYVNTSGRTITLHTENSHLCQIITTFTTGLTALNGLTAQVQYFQTGTSGTDFNISSLVDIHTFNLPTASATNRGALSSADWTTFNSKQNALTNPVTGTGAAGRVAYWNGSGTITSDSLFQWNDFSKRLGIGRTPTVSLDVEGAGFFSGTVTASSIIKSGGTSSQYLMADGSVSTLTNPVTGTGTTNYLPKFTGTSTIGNSVIQEASSNIGIGGTPSYKLDIQSTTDASLLQLISSATANNTALRIGIDGNNAFINASGGSTGILQLRTYGTTRATLDANGNLGLGVTPSAGGLSGYVLFELANGGASIYSGANQNLNGTNISWSGGTASYKISNFATLYNQQSGQHQWFNAPSGTAGNAITFTQAMTLTSGGNLLVGTTSDNGARLQVSGTATFSSSVTALGAINVGSAGSLQINAGSAATPLLTQSTTYTELYRRSGGVGIYLGGTGDPGNYYDNTSHFFRSSGGGSTYLTINSSGNLGLGVTPSAWSGVKALQIGNGSLAATGNFVTIKSNVFYDGVDRYISNSFASDYYQLSGQHVWQTAPSGTAGNAITFTQAMTLTSGGNLLVGTTTDNGARLQVSGTAAIGSGTQGINTDADLTLREGVAFVGLDFKSARTSGNVGGLRFYNTSSDSVPIAQQLIETDGKFVFYNGTSGAESRLTITSSGNVGIGTASPNARLELTSNSPSSAEVQRWSYNNGNADFSLRLKQEVTSGLVTHVFDLVNNGTTYSNNLVLTNGNIGISVIPSSWASNYKAIQISSFAALTQGGNDTYLGNNWFNDGSNKYLQTSGASIYGQSNGSHFWLTAPSGTAGNAITFTQAMTLSSSGNLLVGTTTDNGARLQVSGGNVTITNSGNVFSTIKTTTNTGVASYLTQNDINTTTEIGAWGSTRSGFGAIQPNNGYIFSGDELAIGASLALKFGVGGSNTERMRITSGGNVGIGTSSPATYSLAPNLVVDSGANSGGLTIKTGNTASTSNYGFIGFADGTSGSEQYRGFIQYSHNFNTFSDCLLFGTSGTEQMRITSGGNVLIGTTTAQSGTKLQVAGVMDVWSSSNTLLRFNHDGTRGIIETFTGGGYGPTSINPNGGNVLIGTTTDSGARLQVSGTGTISSNLTVGNGTTAVSLIINRGAAGDGNGLRFATAGTLNWYIGSAGTSTNTDLEIYNHNTATTNLRFAYSTGAATFSSSVSGTSIRSSAVGSFGFNTANNGEFQIYATAANGMIMAGRGSSTDMVITNKNGADVFTIPTGTTIANFVGNVGIGTSSPGNYILATEYNASGLAVMSIKNSSATGYSGAHIFNNSGNFMAHFGYGNASLTAPLSDLVYFGSIASKAVVFTTSDTERMRITSSGNVLIGTTTDVGARLYVDGAFRTGTLTAGTQTAAVDWRLGNARGGTATANALIRVQINGVLVDLIGNYV